MANTALATTASALATLTQSMTAGSLRALVNARKKNAVVLVDTSGSMIEAIRSKDTGWGGASRKIDELRKVAVHLKTLNPDVPFIAFHGATAHVVGEAGIPDPSGSTPMAKAILLATAVGADHAVLVSDGQPDDTYGTIEAAKAFRGKIDTFFIGNDHEFGAQFLSELAAMTGGKSNVTDLGEPKQLAAKISGLLGDGSTAAPASTVFAL